MNIDEFKFVVTTFADPETPLLFESSSVVFSVNGEVIDISISRKSGDVFVVENESNPIPANTWILKRLANLPLLATRLREMIKPTAHFVSPASNILQTLENKPDAVPCRSNDTLKDAFVTLNNRSHLETSVIYITSDAGEGKTSLINEMARDQATRFSKNESDWLLVPIALGGRHFLRFDDITVGALQNRYRFPYLYYNSFLALVRMGVIVPAFDGFEEMFVENSSGEAVSAMGILVAALDSTGAVLIAARKAYFEFENLKAQEKLYESINLYSVGFGKIELIRWEKEQFLKYCLSRNINNSENIYQTISDRIGSNHPLLTRPVLVKRLLDIVTESDSMSTFIEKISSSGVDYFSVFVQGIIEREATEKWIDRSGEIGSPLLSAYEHCKLLASIALGMWEARVDHLKRDHLEFLSDLFCETEKKSPHQTAQIRERLRGHALLVTSNNSPNAVEFDHDEFRLFFLGEGLADQLSPLNDRSKVDTLNSLRRGILPEQSKMAFLRAIKRNPSNICVSSASLLAEIAMLDGQVSYTQENCAELIIKLLNNEEFDVFEITNLTFGNEIFRDCSLSNITFINCYFSSTNLENTKFQNCTFEECKFGQLRIYNSTAFDNCLIKDSTVEMIKLVDKNTDIYDPSEIQIQLSKFKLLNPIQANIFNDNIINTIWDTELLDFEKILRYFLRSTHIGTTVILIKLSERGQSFIDDVLPKILEHKIMSEIENRSGPVQRRFKLGKSLESLHDALAVSKGSFTKFLSQFPQK